MHIHIECTKEESLYPIGKGIENETMFWILHE
jgi:hypothetical protein